VRNYPFNCWWAAAATDEVSRKPLSRWLLEQRVVLFRTAAGDPVALADRCAHRWAPLSDGKLIGDDIACPYHGFRYNADGVCTLVPTQAHAPTAMKVKSYPVREHASFVWIWMGDPAQADGALLPELPWFTDPAYFIPLRAYNGELKCNYLLLQENLMDLTHIPYVHAGAYEQYGGWHKAPEVKATDRSVSFVQRDSDVLLPPSFASALGIEAAKRVNRTDRGTFTPPACTVIGSEYQDLTPVKGQRDHCNTRVLHCVTPISPQRCHYWIAVALDFGHEIANFAEESMAGWDVVIKQDQSILESIQLTLERDRRDNDTPEVFVRADAAAVEARRSVKRLLEAEM